MLGTPEPEQAPAGTSLHAWPDLCPVFHMLLVKPYNSLPVDPGNAPVGGHQVMCGTEI